MARRLGGKEIYDCASCAIRPHLKTALGHDGPPTGYYKENLLTGEPLSRCPVRDMLDADPQLVSEIARHADEYYPAYKEGHLPTAGGIADQPARTMDFIREIARLDADAQRVAKTLGGDDDEEGEE